MTFRSHFPIGIFDSGIGGISVLRAIRGQMPEESVIYFGDQGHIPYGPRPMEQIRNFSEAISKFLLSQNAKIIVVACNTASAAALKYLRDVFPEVPFVGMEPRSSLPRNTRKQAKLASLPRQRPSRARCTPLWWNGLQMAWNCSKIPVQGSCRKSRREIWMATKHVKF